MQKRLRGALGRILVYKQIKTYYDPTKGRFLEGASN